MEEPLVKFETAKIAKRIGFDLLCQYYYDSDNPLSVNIEIKKHFIISPDRLGTKISTSEPYSLIPINEAPTQSFLQKWLRDVKGYHIIIIPEAEDKFECHILCSFNFKAKRYIGQYKTYEDGLEACLKFICEVIENNKED